MKSTKRWLVILLLILMSLIFGGCGYEEDFPPTISGGNPPIIDLPTRGWPLSIWGPYTLDQLKRRHKITYIKDQLSDDNKMELKRIFGDKDYSIWRLDPFGSPPDLPITYGVVPEGYKQIYPVNGHPIKLKEGNIYGVTTPPYYGNISKSAYFVIKNGKTITINEDDLSE